MRKNKNREQVKMECFYLFYIINLNNDAEGERKLVMSPESRRESP